MENNSFIIFERRGLKDIQIAQRFSIHLVKSRGIWHDITTVMCS